MAKPIEWIDGHLDLACLAEAGRQLAWPAEAQTHGLLPAAVSLPALEEGGVKLIVGTIFVQRTPHAPGPPAPMPWYYATPDEAHLAALRQVGIYLELAQRGWVTLEGRGGGGESGVRAQGPAQGLRTATPTRVLLMLEGCAPIRTVRDIHTFHLAGVRLASLAWAEGSPWAGGNNTGADLTPAGRDLVAAMDALHMVHDVSHLSEPAFWSLLAHAQGPKVATHSNCRALLPHADCPQRHLSDQQILALANAGGIIGINLYTKFLRTDGQRATSADVLRHIEHIVALTGRKDCLGLGSDMDGGFSADLLPTDLDHPRKLPVLAEKLSQAHWTDPEIRGFASENWRRFLRTALGVAVG